ncbi:outer membrane protein [Pseudolabrys taiwanensis]|nr:outer membrane protein [Pseudolabrys taiwanensis]
MTVKKVRIAIAVAGLLFVAPFAAQAADMPQPAYKAPPVYIAPFTWTGFYVGVNGGYMRGTSQWTGGAGDFSVSPNGWMIGGTLGYNIQTGNWVWGVEGDIDYANLKGTTNGCSSCTTKQTWLSTVRGRIGWAFDRWMPYITGGGAFGNAYVSTAGGSVDRTKGGWTAGGGLEWAFADRWSAKAEYLYVDLGSASCGYATCILPADATVSFKANLVRAGVNYRF